MLVGRLCSPLVSLGVESSSVFGSALLVDTRAALVWTQLAVFDSDESHLSRLACRVIERMERARDVTTAVVECTEPAIAQQFCRALDLVSVTPIRTLAVCSDEDFPHQHQPTYGGLTEGVLARLQILTRVTPSLAEDVESAASLLPPNELAALIDGAESSVDLVRNVTTALILGATDETRDALGVAALLGYAHPDLACVTSAVIDCRRMPFWAPLERGWLRMRSSWREGIYLACRSKERSRPFPVEEAVRDLLDSRASHPMYSPPPRTSGHCSIAQRRSGGGSIDFHRTSASVTSPSSTQPHMSTTRGTPRSRALGALVRRPRRP
jgi:hypothetical protein